MAWGHMQTWGWLCEPCQMRAWDKAHFCGDRHKEMVTKQWKDGWPNPSQFGPLGKCGRAPTARALTRSPGNT
eukprot:3436925-Pyramimonas_sp.AAC.1